MDATTGRQADQLRNLQRALDRPSDLYLETMHEVAHRLGVAAEPLLGGHGVLVNGTVFHATHYGAADRDGVTLVMEIGAIPADNTAACLTQLLEYNLSPQAALSGFYGVVPDTGVIVMRARIDLTKAGEGPAGAVLHYMKTYATQMQNVRDMLKAGVELAKVLHEQAQAPDEHEVSNQQPKR